MVWGAVDVVLYALYGAHRTNHVRSCVARDVVNYRNVIPVSSCFVIEAFRSIPLDVQFTIFDQNMTITRGVIVVNKGEQTSPPSL